MLDSRIGVRYARALFELAGEKKQQKYVREDLNGLHQLMGEVTLLEQVFVSPLVRGSEKEKIIDKLFRDLLNPLTMDFLTQLIRQKREAALVDVCRAYNQLFKRELGIIEAEIISVEPLKPELVERLKKWLGKSLESTIELEQRVREELIGGFILRMDDRQMDASVSTQLQHVRQELKQALFV